MAAVEILCPHCGSKQKVPERRVAGAVTCLKCEKLVPDAYLYKVAPEQMELNVALKGKLISEFGTTKLDELKAKSDAYTGRDTDMIYESHEDTDKAPGFNPLEIHIGSNRYSSAAVNKHRVLTSAARTYVIGGVILLSVLVVGSVVAWQLMDETQGTEKIRTTGEGNVRTLMHSNGREKARWTVAETDQGEVIDGLYEEWWPSGKPKLSGQYAMGLKNGTWRSFHEVGPLEAEEHYDNGTPVGTWTEWHISGQKAGEGSHKDGLRHGRWLKWYPDEQLESVSEYDAGVPVGMWMTFYPDGARHLSGRYELGRKDGKWVSLHDNGAEELVETWIAGQREGEVRGQHANRQRSVTGQYAGGKRVGDWCWFNLSGSVARQGKFVNGQEDGEWIENYPSGALLRKGSYRAGQREGLWEEFSQNGELEVRTEYDAGSISTEQHFFRGEAVEIRRESREDELATEWTVKPGTGTQHGKWREYHKGGTLALEGYFVNGVREGTWTRYDPTGNVIEVYRYINGVAQ